MKSDFNLSNEVVPVNFTEDKAGRQAGYSTIVSADFIVCEMRNDFESNHLLFVDSYKVILW